MYRQRDRVRTGQVSGQARFACSPRHVDCHRTIRGKAGLTAERWLHLRAYLTHRQGERQEH